MVKSDLEEELFSQIKAVKLPAPEREFKFHPVRKWRVDFAYPIHNLAIEVEGGTWVSGRHTRGSGYEKDCEKYNELSLAGYHLLRITGNMVKDGRGIAFIERAFGRDGTEGNG